MRPKPPQPHHAMHGVTPVGHFAQHLNNVQGSRKAEPYYCDRTLVQSLVRDAMVTDGLDRNSTGTSNGKEDKQYVSDNTCCIRKHAFFLNFLLDLHTYPFLI